MLHWAFTMRPLTFEHMQKNKGVRKQRCEKTKAARARTQPVITNSQDVLLLSFFSVAQKRGLYRNDWFLGRPLLQKVFQH